MIIPYIHSNGIKMDSNSIGIHIKAFPRYFTLQFCFVFDSSYVPRDYPQIQYLKIAGINVDVSLNLIFNSKISFYYYICLQVRKSTKKSVFLHSVNLATRGKYRCEISAEAPSFITAAKEGFLDINGTFTQYVSIDDMINVIIL